MATEFSQMKKISPEEANIAADRIFGDAEQARLERRYSVTPMLYPMYRSRELAALEPWKRNQAIKEAQVAVYKMPKFVVLLALWIGIVALLWLDAPVTASSLGGGASVFGSILVVFIRAYFVRDEARRIAIARTKETTSVST